MTRFKSAQWTVTERRSHSWSLVIGHWSLLAVFVLSLVSCMGKQPTHPDDASIRAFLTRYFSTWSAKDMDGYAACFHPQARVLFMTESGQVASEGLTDFLHGQRLAHETA